LLIDEEVHVHTNRANCKFVAPRILKTTVRFNDLPSMWTTSLLKPPRTKFVTGKHFAYLPDTLFLAW